MRHDEAGRPQQGRPDGKHVRWEAGGRDALDVPTTVEELKLVAEIEIAIKEQRANIDVVVDAVGPSDAFVYSAQITHPPVEGGQQHVSRNKCSKHARPSQACRGVAPSRGSVSHLGVSMPGSVEPPGPMTHLA